ncbi:hypothetical protein IMCC14465_16140 [alpha proteobacterium IMCC14465]|uniref:Uncharacterized protein n=1 Tax=alpha proteobacterium IMCC14465 TaxID=1220535 RepID=J9DUP2_9PROT|nr:hypothetical protein IMCC14465_16140 [alpha proteobacterium IMCC14465]
MLKKKILIIKLGAFGDIILSEGLMRCIRSHHPNDHITLLTRKSYVTLMEGAPHFDAVMIDPHIARWHIHKQFRFRRLLLEQNFDYVYDLQNNARSQGFQKWLKGAQISARFDDAAYHDDLQRNPHKSIRDILAQQIAHAGVNISDGILPDLRWAAPPPDEIDSILTAAGLKSNFVLLIPGSSAKNAQKRWGYYKELAQMLKAQGIACATVPGHDERALCETIDATMLLDDGKPLSFQQMAGLEPHCRYVVGNDTGPTHLMSAVKTKGLVLFARNNFSAARTGIDKIYDVITVDNFDDLKPQQVLAHIQKAY